MHHSLMFIDSATAEELDRIEAAVHRRRDNLAQLAGGLTDGEIASIRAGRIIDAIKSYRVRCGVTLLMAKDAVDKWQAEHPSTAKAETDIEEF